MRKCEARRIYAERRNAITPAEKNKQDDLLLIQFQKMDLPFLGAVLSFYPIEEKREVNTFILTDYLRFKNPGLTVAYPKTDFATHTIQAVVCGDETEFKKNTYYIPEPVSDDIVLPAELDAVLVPLLLCDRYGNRVGYGKGFYDRFLQQCRADCLKIGLSYFEPVDGIEDANEFDVPLTVCITPLRTYVF